MANKTREDIKNQIYQYLPQINQTAKSTLIHNAIDLAVEDISQRHDFKVFRATTPDSATLTAGAYSLNLSDFSTMGASTTYFKDVRAMFRLKSGTADHDPIKYIDDLEFHHRFGYVDYTSRTSGYPTHYTLVGGTKFLFNCPASESLTIRCWYNTFHPPMTYDAQSHSFDTSMNMVAFQAIVHQALVELKHSLSSAEFPMELQTITQMAELYISKLIARDIQKLNEEFELGTSEHPVLDQSPYNPYEWV